MFCVSARSRNEYVIIRRSSTLIIQTHFQNGTPVAKKPRAKPKIQENVDVEALAKSNMVSFSLSYT